MSITRVLPEHIAGFCLLNDWSARDIQTWEYQPLGPFLAKNFMTSISPWIVTADALQPFRIAQASARRRERAAGPLPYLWDEADQAQGAFDIEMQVHLRTAAMQRGRTGAAAHSESGTRGTSTGLAAQMLAHHAGGGCNLRAGDLFGSGTISSERCGGSLLELSRGGSEPLRLANGEQRAFLLDGDEIILSAQARKSGFVSIGSGEGRGGIHRRVIAGRAALAGGARDRLRRRSIPPAAAPGQPAYRRLPAAPRPAPAMNAHAVLQGAQLLEFLGAAPAGSAATRRMQQAAHAIGVDADMPPGALAGGRATGRNAGRAARAPARG